MDSKRSVVLLATISVIALLIITSSAIRGLQRRVSDLEAKHRAEERAAMGVLASLEAAVSELQEDRARARAELDAQSRRIADLESRLSIVEESAPTAVRAENQELPANEVSFDREAAFGIVDPSRLPEDERQVLGPTDANDLVWCLGPYGGFAVMSCGGIGDVEALTPDARAALEQLFELHVDHELARREFAQSRIDSGAAQFAESWSEAKKIQLEVLQNPEAMIVTRDDGTFAVVDLRGFAPEQELQEGRVSVAEQHLRESGVRTSTVSLRMGGWRFPR